jgi:tight adherence protein B
MHTRPRAILTRIGWTCALGVAVSAMLPSAYAAPQGGPQGRIDHVDSRAGIERVLFSVPGLQSSARPDLSSVVVTVDGLPVHATATLASHSGASIRRTTMLVLDTSASMNGARLAAAKAAALQFLARAPADVRIGLVTFADRVNLAEAPTTDRSAVRAALAHITIASQTHLYDGIRAALGAAGRSGQRQLLVLTDGRDTSTTPVSSVVRAVRASGDRVDVVGINLSPAALAAMSQVTRAGNGSLVNPADAGALTALLRGQARALADQVLVSFPIPRSEAGVDANLQVGVQAGGTTYTDDAYVSIGKLPSHGARLGPVPVARPTSSSTPLAVLVGGAVAIGAALLLLVALLLGVFRPEPVSTAEELLAGYGMLAAPVSAPTGTATTSVRESAVGIAAKAIQGGGLEERLNTKLDAAGLTAKPAEWVLLQIGLGLGAGLAGYLVTSGNLMITVLLLLVAGVLPWLYLGMKASKRIRAFQGQLADALQLLAGGLKAGLSFAQSLDTIVREGVEPMAGEFRRALVQARLGMGVEDALDTVADRMESDDLRWVVMAVRIQREVGGNLAELLLTVATTLRERDYLRRQVRSLSAEGRLSAYVLCAMPFVFLAYMTAVNPSQLSDMFHTAIGIALCVIGLLLMAVGVFWMSRVVKVEI